MIKKPAACISCKWYDNGWGFVPDEIVKGAEVTLVGQGPGADEEATGVPFCGDTGQKLNSRFLPLAGLERGKINVCNVLKCRPTIGGRRTNDLPYDPKERKEVSEYCFNAHFTLPPATKTIIAHGELAWKTLGGPGNVHDWRGYSAPSNQGPPMFCTIHIANLSQAEPELTIPSMHDWVRLGRFIRGDWPKPMPRYISLDKLHYKDIENWFNNAKDFIGIDTEFFPDSNKLWLTGLYYPGAEFVLQVHHLLITYAQEMAFRSLFTDLIKRIPSVFHNALADIPVLRQSMGISWEDFFMVEDTMQGHAVLWPEYPHTLEFVDSMHGEHEKLKQLQEIDPDKYNAGDVLSTVYAWITIKKELEKDGPSWGIYREQMEICPYIDESMSRGIRVSRKGVERAVDIYTGKVEEAIRIAQGYCGYPINLGSDPQVSHWIYTIEGMPKKKRKGNKRIKAADSTVNKDAIGELRGTFLGFDASEKPEIKYILDRIDQGAHPLLEARYLHQGARQCITNHLTHLYGEWGNNNTIAHRIYHTIHLHTQANSRWSYVRPPLAATPRDMRYIYEPDEDWPWGCWDYDQYELRIVASESRDRPLLDSFEAGHDVHVKACCEIFGYKYPPSLIDPVHNPLCAEWRLHYNWGTCDHEREICGKVDNRREFGKQFQYRMCMGGKAKETINMPSARALGLGLADVLRGYSNWATVHSAVIDWQRKIMQQTRDTRMTRTWHGRRRIYNGHIKNIGTQGVDHPSQAGAQDKANLVFLEIKRRFKDAVYYVYGMHDSMNWAIQRKFFSEIWPEMQIIAQKPSIINGILTKFPASFKTRGI
jgi:uracil-DNA glycosylase family 4